MELFSSYNLIIEACLIMTWTLIRDKRKPATILDELAEEFELRDQAYEEAEQGKPGKFQILSR